LNLYGIGFSATEVFQHHARFEVLIADGLNYSTTPQAALKEGLAQPGQTIVIAAGMPFGTGGSANLLHIARLD
jgi:hypothetical protein